MAARLGHRFDRIHVMPPAGRLRPRSSGQALPEPVREKMEGAFGHDFSGIRVHEDGHAASVAAQAYTQGEDLHFAPGKYQPHSESGQRLLGHELAHVIQQRAGRVAAPQDKRLPINDDERLEAEADALGVRAARGEALQGPAASAAKGLPGLAGASAQGPVIQRVQIQDSATGEFHRDTDEMSAQERLGLALRFYQLHNLNGLQQLRDAHPDEDFSDATLLSLANPVQQDSSGKLREERESRGGGGSLKRKEVPRVRKRHDWSEGESESENPDIVFRSLRPEEEPFTSGLKPPKGHDPTITLSAHMTSGTKAKMKSPWVSTSRSLKVAGAWASKQNRRVAKARIPKHLREAPDTVYDMTDPVQAMRVFPKLKGSSYNTTLASQEVAIKGGLDKEAIEELFEAKKLSVKEFERLKQLKAQGKAPANLYALMRSRAEVQKNKKKTTPHPFALYRIVPSNQEDNGPSSTSVKGGSKETSDAENEVTPRPRKKKKKDPSEDA